MGHGKQELQSEQEIPVLYTWGTEQEPLETTLAICIALAATKESKENTGN